MMHHRIPNKKKGDTMINIYKNGQKAIDISIQKCFDFIKLDIYTVIDSIVVSNKNNKEKHHLKNYVKYNQKNIAKIIKKYAWQK